MKAVRFLGLVVLTAAPLAWAEAPVLSSHSVLPEGALVSVWGTSRGFGVGGAIPLAASSRRHFVVEGQWNIPDRAGEIRAAWTWGLATEGVFTSMLSLGPTVAIVPYGAFDVGMGPHVSLFLGLGGTLFRVELGIETGVEVFARTGGPRFPQRTVLGFHSVFERFTGAVMLRAGTDIELTRPFVGRIELVFAFGFRPVDEPERYEDSN